MHEDVFTATVHSISVEQLNSEFLIW